MTLKQWRTWYEGSGWRVFPVVGKRPVMGLLWKNEEATEEQWEGATGLALIVGEGIGVLDIDRHAEGCGRPEDGSCTCEMPWKIASALDGDTVCAATPSGGVHLFFNDPDGIVRCTTKEIHPQIDTKGQGKGYVVLAPSIHPNGKPYEWIIAPGTAEFSELPESVKLKLLEGRNNPKDLRELFKKGVQEGGRASTAAAIAGLCWKLLARTFDEVNEENLEAVSALLAFWDRRNRPPLGEEETRRIAYSIGKTHYGGLGKRGSDFAA